MDPRRPYPPQNQNPLVPRRDWGKVSTDISGREIAEQASHSQRIRPPVSSRDQEGSSTNRALRQRENDGRPQQHPQLPILGGMHREGEREPSAAQIYGVHSPGYGVPRDGLQQVQSPTGLAREWTTPPSNLDPGRPRDEWRHGLPYSPVPPTPQREQVVNAQGLNNRHHDTLQSLPQVRQ